MTYRHWFIISVLVLFNTIIFGCIMLAELQKIRVGF